MKNTNGKLYNAFKRIGILIHLILHRCLRNNESKDLCERIANFKNRSNELLERYGNGAAQHYQYENAIMAYLWLRYPDKYYIYKFSEVKAVSSELESDYRFKKGAYVDNIRNFMALYDEICAELQQDNGNKRRIFQNFLDAKAGDMVIRYESTPVKQIVAIFRVNAEQDGERIYFEKLEGLSSPIDFAI